MILTINDKKHETVNCYEGLATHRFQRLHKEWGFDKPVAERDPFQLFCILNDLPFKKVEPTEENEAAVWSAIKWYFDTQFDLTTEEVPKVIQIDDKMIDLPENPALLSSGQNIALRQAIDGTTYLNENIAIALAIYLQPIYDNTNREPGKKKVRFEMKRARELEKKIEQLPITVTGPAGFFLLVNALPSGKNSARTWPQILFNLRRKLKNRLRSLREWVA